MKNSVAKLVAGTVLGASLVVGSFVAPVAPVVEVQAAQSVVEKEFKIPEVFIGEKYGNGIVDGQTYAADTMGTQFKDYATFTDYKKVRDYYFNDDLEMAKDYWEMFDRDIMPTLEKEYFTDIYRAKVYYGYVSERDAHIGLQFKNYANLEAYEEARYVFFEMDLPMVDEYEELMGSNILPILQREYDRDVALAKEYYAAKKYGVIK